MWAPLSSAALTVWGRRRSRLSPQITAQAMETESNKHFGTHFIRRPSLQSSGLPWALPGPNLYIRIFMEPTAEILAMAPAIIRCYGLSFLLLPLNIFSTYYFQAILKPKAAFVVSVSRGLVISGILILLLPITAGADMLWFAMPITELLVMFYAASRIRIYTKRLPDETLAAVRNWFCIPGCTSRWERVK